jgi:hypothetical protein
MKKVKKLGLLAVLLIAAMALPSQGSAEKICDEEYYYDAAHTQWAGFCWKLCYPSPEYNCMGERTMYYVPVNCSPSCDT